MGTYSTIMVNCVHIKSLKALTELDLPGYHGKHWGSGVPAAPTLQKPKGWWSDIIWGMGYTPLLAWVIPGNKTYHSLRSAVPFLSSNAVCGQAKWAVVKRLT